MRGLLLPVEVPYSHRHAWHIYTPLINLEALTIGRDEFMAELKARNFDLEGMRAAGYAYERLDQLTVELLLGVR